MAPVRLLLVDDSADLRTLVRVVLAAHPELEVVGEAVNGSEAVEKAAALQPDVVLLDAAMPVMTGVEAIPLIRRASPGSAVAVFTSFDSWGLAAIPDADARIEKGLPPDELAAALLALAASRR